jgi:hypothetical protein
MKFWFYAVIVETEAWFNAAIRAENELQARKILATKFPHGRIHDIYR